MTTKQTKSNREDLRRPPTTGAEHVEEITFKAQTTDTGHRVVAVLADDVPVAYIPVARCVAVNAARMMQRAAHLAACGGTKALTINIATGKNKPEGIK